MGLLIMIIIGVLWLYLIEYWVIGDCIVVVIWGIVVVMICGDILVVGVDLVYL